uniref:Rab interacting lysosomal protein like 2 n=1 Tax=Serinus canaria TaxID=9135 RepID=A0A8C9N383_SERCA
MLVDDEPVGISVGLQERALLFVLNKSITLGKSRDQVSNQTDLPDVSIAGKNLFQLLFSSLKVEPCHEEGEVWISRDALVGYVPCQHRPPYGPVVGLGPDQMVIDLTDPNRPRFTLQELRDVLQERNQLKAQLLVVQEELQCYKSGIISQKRDQTEELDKEASGSSAGTRKDSEEKTIIKRL